MNALGNQVLFRLSGVLISPERKKYHIYNNRLTNQFSRYLTRKRISEKNGVYNIICYYYFSV